MHIGFVAHNFVRGNGQGRINFEIVRHARSCGHNVTLLADAVSPELLDLGVRLLRVKPLIRRPNLVGAYDAARVGDRSLRSERKSFDVVIGAGFTLRAQHDVSLCQFVHGAWLRSPVHVAKLRGGMYGLYQRAYTAANAKWEKQAYAAAKCIVAPSDRIKQELISIGVPSHRVRVIYNGVDLDEFRPVHDEVAKRTERETLRMPLDVPMALFVGDIRTPRKNLDSVLKALVSLPHVHLTVVGKLALSPYPALAEHLGIAERVHFTDFTFDVKRYMRASDLFVFPSRYEAGTLVLMEAAASGLPLVTAATAGGAEIFDGEAATVLPDPDDVPALAAAIRRFTTDRTTRERSGRAARAIVEHHSWTQMADEYLALFASYARKGAA